MILLHVVTPVSRAAFLDRLGRELADSLDGLDWRWWVSFDRAVPERERSAPAGTVLVPGDWTRECGATGRNLCLDRIASGWVWHCDDDNLPHPDFAAELLGGIVAHPEARGFVFAQERGPGRVSRPGACGGYDVDTAQFVFRRDAIGAVRWNPDRYDHDRQFVEDVEGIIGRTAIVRSDVTACYHNRRRWPESTG